MRPLAFFILFFAAPYTYGITQTLGMNSSYQSIHGSADPAGLLGQTQTSQFNQTLQYKIEGLIHGLTLATSFSDVKPDYSNFMITQKGGTSLPLTDVVKSQDEFVGSLSVSWNRGSHNASLSWNGHLSESPFASETFGAKYFEGFFNNTTLLGTSLSVFQMNQPQTYFIDLNFQSRQRPTVLHGVETSLFWDQMISERWKGSLEISTGTREEDRPQHVGFSLKQGYAVSDRFFTQLELSHVFELTSQSLKDERGYFALNTAEVSVTYEPVIDFLLSTSYAYVVETENNPQSGLGLQVGSDQYGLGLKYRKGVMGYLANSALRYSNTGLRDVVVGLGVSWQI